MFEERAREAVARAQRRGETAALLFLDLDNFKDINDNLGHEVGDALLRAAAERLRGCVRGEDFVARIGGDEFCVLLQGLAEPREAAGVAQKVVEALGAALPHRRARGRFRAPASASRARRRTAPRRPSCCGWPMRPCTAPRRPGATPTALRRPTSTASCTPRPRSAEELRASLERDELFVCYQPRIDFLTRRPVGGRSAAALAAPALRAAAAGVVPAARRGRRHRRARWARCC